MKTYQQILQMKGTDFSFMKDGIIRPLQPILVR